MALQKTKDTQFGIETSYWRVTKIHLDSMSNYSFVVVSGYIDKNNRDDGKTPITYKEYTWRDSENPFLIDAMASKNVFQLAYEKLKTLPEWESSEDV